MVKKKNMHLESLKNKKGEISVHLETAFYTENEIKSFYSYYNRYDEQENPIPITEKYQQYTAILSIKTY